MRCVPCVTCECLVVTFPSTAVVCFAYLCACVCRASLSTKEAAAAKVRAQRVSDSRLSAIGLEQGAGGCFVGSAVA